MTTSPRASIDPPTERVWLEQFLGWLNPAILGLAILDALLFVATSNRPLLPVAVLMVAFMGVLLWSRRQVRGGRLSLASLVISSGLLAGGMIGVLLAPIALPVVMLVPLMAVAVALPYLSAAALRRLIIVSWLVMVANAFLAKYTFVEPSERSWPTFLLNYLPLLVSIGAIGALILLLLWQYRSRLTRLLEQTRVANAALRAIQARLEADVLARTTEAREREDRYRAISELTSDYVYAVRIAPDGTWTFEWVTEAFATMIGYTQADVTFETWLTMIHPEDLPVVQRHSTTIGAGRSHVCDFRIIAKDGTVRWLRDYTRPEWDAGHERIVRVLGAAQDITERKHSEEEQYKLERKLLETQKLESLGVLAGGIAHDFNNMLMSIQGNAGLALRDLPAGSCTRESVEQIEVVARRAADLTRQMLAYTGRGHFFLQPLDLNALAEEMIMLLNVSVAKTARLHYNLASQLPPIEADSSQIRQVVMNLIINASEAIGEANGTITVSTSLVQADRAYLAETYLAPDLAPGAYIRLEVADSGCGMDANMLTKIFDPFFSTKFAGRGLGLAAVLGIVRGHKGALKVQSECGQGTTFTILFPAIAVAQKHIEPVGLVALDCATVAPLEAPVAQGLTVLIVDDERSVRTVAARMLERLGYTALIAGDSQAGLETFRVHTDAISCVLLDMTLPHINGEQVFHAISSLKPGIPIVLMSGYGEDRANNHFDGYNVVGFLRKPFARDALAEKIWQAVGDPSSVEV